MSTKVKNQKSQNSVEKTSKKKKLRKSADIASIIEDALEGNKEVEVKDAEEETPKKKKSKKVTQEVVQETPKKKKKKVVAKDAEEETPKKKKKEKKDKTEKVDRESKYLYPEDASDSLSKKTFRTKTRSLEKSFTSKLANLTEGTKEWKKLNREYREFRKERYA